MIHGWSILEASATEDGRVKLKVMADGKPIEGTFELYTYTADSKKGVVRFLVSSGNATWDGEPIPYRGP